MNKTTLLLIAAVCSTSSALAQGGDDCSIPTPINTLGSFAFDSSAATTSSFNGGGSCNLTTLNQDLFWVFTAPVSGALRIDTIGSTFDTQLLVHSGSNCSAICEVGNDDGAGTQSLVNIGFATAGEQFLIQVGGFGNFGPGSSSGAGMLNIQTTTGPCLGIPDDAFDGNDDCPSAQAITSGFFPGLWAFDSANDYFAVTIAPGATLDATISFIDDNGNLDLYLWDPAVGCDTNVVSQFGPSVERSDSTTDDETLSYTNFSSGAQTFILEINVLEQVGCNTYDLTITGAEGSGGSQGSNYCPGNANSTGVAAVISAEGSRMVADNDLTLTASNLPPLSFGFFLASRDQALVINPGGSQGNLCLGGAIGRYVGQGQIMNSGTQGEISLGLDLTVIPQPNGATAVMPGDDWNFQLWHRDMTSTGATSNLTNGITITFI